MTRWIAVATALLASTPCLAQNGGIGEHPRVREALRVLEVWIDAQQAYQTIPGISMALVHDQELLWSGGFGYANPERRIPAAPETLYAICSISKLFTSIGVMQLRDRGKLELHDPIKKHLEWFRIQDTYPDAPPVTIEGILTHSSGLPRESDHPYWSEPDYAFPTREQIVERIANQAELYPAAEYFQYSNLGLTLAGEIVAAASAQPYNEYVRSHILEPLQMTSTRTDIPTELHGERMALGYAAHDRAGHREKIPVFQARGIAPAAGFASTVLDLAKFASWQFRVLHHGSSDVLARNTLREMHRVHWMDPDWETTWGLGFAVWRDDDKTFVGHGGSCPGYRSQLLIQPDDKLAVIFMANANGVDTRMHAQRAYELVAPVVKDALDAKSKTESFPANLARYVGAYSSAPWGGETAVVIWNGQLALLSLPTSNPERGLVELKHINDHTFRRVRSDKSLGEAVVFEVDETGRVIQMWRHSNFSRKVR